MSDQTSNHPVCIIVGASHAGVNCAFALRREGWTGDIILIDRDPRLPYHRPPLSKTYLTGQEKLDQNVLRSRESYDGASIQLRLGTSVTSIDRQQKLLLLDNGSKLNYHKLVLATGARALIPSIPGLAQAEHVFTLRTFEDVSQIQSAFDRDTNQRVVIIGAGYIGLEIAASLRKIGAQVTVLEREERVMARVTTPEMSRFFQELHTQQGVIIHTGKNVISTHTEGSQTQLVCSDESRFTADLIVVGVGIRVNQELAEEAGIEVKDGIVVDAEAQTSDENVYAIGDNTYHYNPHYGRHIRLECVQNAVDQGKIAAASICGKHPTYDKIPWFWSDQYEVKLQIVGLSDGYNECIIRREKDDDQRFSIWYFKDDELLAVDAVNHAKAYVLGTKFIKNQIKIDKFKLVDPEIALKPADLMVANSI